MDQLRELIIKHEGIRLKPYRDTLGKLTIGVGRNLDDVGLTKDECLIILENDLTRSEIQLVKYDWFVCMNDVRKGVLIELVFNVGMSKALTFKNMIEALKIKDYPTAAKELLDSVWSKQVGYTRSNNMANRLMLGKYT